MELGKELVSELYAKEIFSFTLFGYRVSVTDSVVVMWIIMAVLIVFSVFFTGKMKTIPEGKQNFIEIIVETINSFVKSTIGQHWAVFAPYLGTVFIFLIVSNSISIFSIIPEWEQLYELTHWEVFKHLPPVTIKPPTKDLNVTVALAFMSVVMVAYGGIKIKKVSGWLRSYIEPVALMLPMKIIENFIRILSLSFRLFGNVLGAFIIMELLYLTIPLIIPAGLSIYFDLFDGILQAFVFVFLTTLYMAEAVE